MIPTWRKYYIRYKTFFLQVYKLYQQRPDLKAYLEILLSLVAISIFAVFAIRPTLVTIGKLINEIREKQKTSMHLDKKIEDTAKAKELYKTFQNQISLLNQAVPGSPEVESFVLQFEGSSIKYSVLPDSYGIESVTIKEDNPAASVNTQFLVYKVNSKAGYENIVEFLEYLEKYRRPFGINIVNLTPITNEEAIEIAVTFDGQVPYLKLPDKTHEEE